MKGKEQLIPFILAISGLLCSGHTLASQKCSLETYDKIYVLKDTAITNYRGLIKKSDCPFNIQKKFIELVSNFNGMVRSRYLKTAFKNTFHPYEEINIIPPKINVAKLESLISRRIKLSNGFQWKDLKINNKQAIGLMNYQSMGFNCSKCDSTGKKIVKARIFDPIENKRFEFWIEGALTVEATALVARKNLQVTGKGLSLEHFRSSRIKTASPEIFFNDTRKINFYKLNKAITTGHPLNNSDVFPIDLVKVGNPTKMILKNRSIFLTGTAVAQKSGKYGETVKLRKRKSNKEIIGRVIDYNKVLIEP